MASAKIHVLRNIISRESLYSGRILDLQIDHVKFPSGSEKIREVVKHKSAAAILPVDADGNIYLVQQYRHAVDEDLYEIPAGIIEPGEDPLETAVRELQEEIGYRPGKIEIIFDCYTSPGYSTERIFFYYATDLIPSKLLEDDDEYLQVFVFSPEDIISMINSGEICDGKTIMAYYWYAAKKATDNASD